MEQDQPSKKNSKIDLSNFPLSLLKACIDKHSIRFWICGSLSNFFTKRKGYFGNYLTFTLIKRIAVAIVKICILLSVNKCWSQFMVMKGYPTLLPKTKLLLYWHLKVYCLHLQFVGQENYFFRPIVMIYGKVNY